MFTAATSRTDFGARIEERIDAQRGARGRRRVQRAQPVFVGRVDVCVGK